MNTVQIAAEKLQAAKSVFAELLDKQTQMIGEAERLTSLLQATEADVAVCIEERKAFIASGGDVFDLRAKKLRKQEQENAALIDDLRFAIAANRKAADALMFELSKAHDIALGKKTAYVSALLGELVAKILQNPPEDLLRACHFASLAALEGPWSFDVQVIAMHGDYSYEAMFIKKLNELFRNDLRSLQESGANSALVSDDEKALLSIPAFKEKLSPAQAHFLKANRTAKTKPNAFYQMHPEYMGSEDMDARSSNVVAI